MSTNNSISLFAAGNRDLLVKIGDATKSGAVTSSAKRMSRKEYAEANKLDTKVATFDATYKAYLKTQESHGTLLNEAARSAGLIFAATTQRKDKAGNIVGLSIRYSKPPEEKVNASALKMAALEDANKALLARLEALEAKKPAQPELPAAPKK